ncbi:hypothetical protein K3495_g12015 [Podosphaera aphanis]|nr:hypothetical protein K3495_g12015 [Podosphaera aphanis]
MSIYSRDISQAYTQSSSKLARDIYIYAPKEIELPKGTLLKVILPLYAIPEAGTHWFKTYHNHHTSNLKMIPSTFDNCLLFNADGLLGLQTDDTLIASTPKFIELETKELKNAGFKAKPSEKLSVDKPLDFNGVKITLQRDGTLLINQLKQIKKIQLLDTSSFTRGQYIAQRARGAYIATVSQPQASFSLSHAAQVIRPTVQGAELLNRCLSWQLAASGLRFVQLDQRSLRLVTFTYSSFANNADMTSQIGYVIVIADAKNRANILHWQSVKFRRVTRSVLASELYAMSLGFDVAATIRSSLNQILSYQIPLSICVDSKSLYDCLVKLGTTHEKRLMVDLLAIRQSYERREIAEILWIKGSKNPADAMTKEKACDALQIMVDTNRLDMELDGWVERLE